MKIMLTGATGFIGNSVGQELVARGHTVVAVTRNRKSGAQNLTFLADKIECDLVEKVLPAEAFSGIDIVVNLMGESIDGRWTSKKKDRIRKTRSVAVNHLLQNCPASVKAVISASAIGLYGNRNEEELTESSAAGQGFLAEVCQAWERAVLKAPVERKLILRFGMVLSKKGGAFRKLLSLFNRNFGAVLGSGEQWMSFICLDDLVNLICASVEDQRYRGVINGVSGVPIRNRDFTEKLRKKLGVLQLPAAPKTVLRMALGEMSDLILDSQKVKSEILPQLEFSMKYPDLDSILEKELSGLSNRRSLFYAEQFVPYKVEDVFHFFADHENLEKITPDFLQFKIEKVSSPKVEKDGVIDYRLKVRGFPIKWRTLIRYWEPPYYFADMQVKGPYAYWNHSHRFQEVAGGTLMIDEVHYKLPMGLLGNYVAGSFVEKDVSAIFSFRRKVIAQYSFGAKVEPKPQN